MEKEARKCGQDKATSCAGLRAKQVRALRKAVAFSQTVTIAGSNAADFWEVRHNTAQVCSRSHASFRLGRGHHANLTMLMLSQTGTMIDPAVSGTIGKSSLGRGGVGGLPGTASASKRRCTEAWRLRKLEGSCARATDAAATLVFTVVGAWLECTISTTSGHPPRHDVRLARADQTILNKSDLDRFFRTLEPQQRA